MSTEITIQNSTAAQGSKRVSEVVTTNSGSINSGVVADAKLNTLQQSGITDSKNVDEAAKPLAEISKEEVNEAVDEIKSQIKSVGRDINFSVDDELDIVIITVSDKDSEEVVRQIPSKEIVELAKHIEENKGLLLSEEV